MPYEPLHHKYRPQTFKDLVGQETIAQTLSNALKQEKIAPAYLFTGPRGTGKTSSARILAKSLNCLNSDRPTPEPCGQCEACKAIAVGSALDVMEIDAASNTGVDNIREIIERSRFAPVQCRYKIYAIDECHMLSTAAFNALLKTLEEPPPRVVFILATTDPQRVLSTIISRCQRFDYRRIPLAEMTAHLKYIAERENIAIETDALTLIAQIANGGLRDAESLLDQLSLLPETITGVKVWDLVGAVPEQDLLKLLHLINSNDSVGVLQQCRSLLDRGREPLVVLQNLASFYLNLLIAKTAPQRFELTAVTQTCWQQLCAEAANWDTSLILRGQQQLKEAETQLKQTTQPRLWLEVTLLGLLPQTNTAIAPTTATVANPVVAADELKTSSSRQPPAIPAKTVVSAEPLELPKNTDNKVAKIEPAARQTTANQTPHSSSEPTAVGRASATSSSRASESIKSAPVNPQPDPSNQEIWSKVVDCLHPPTTQALLKQQCYLISFDGVTAIVGISSAKLQKLNQGKIPNIEAAFAKVCRHQVKVQLEVGNDRGTTTNTTPPTVAPTQPQPATISETTPATPDKVFDAPLDSQSSTAQNQSAPVPPKFGSTPSPSASFDLNSDRALKDTLKGSTGSSSRQRTCPQLTHPTDSLTALRWQEPSPLGHQAWATPPNGNNTLLVESVNQAKPQAKLLEGGEGLTKSSLDIESVTLAESTVVKPEALTSKLPTELTIAEDEQQLQQAIDNLTHSFEGELVQLANSDEESFEVDESLTSSQNHFDLDRPKAEEYEDDW